MKNKTLLPLIIISSLIFLLISCSKSPDGLPVPPIPPSNTAPSTPTYISPENSSYTTDKTIRFSWNRSYDESDYMKYNLYISDSTETLNTPLYSDFAETVKYVGGFQASQTYYWKVEAVDLSNNKTMGNTWSFTIQDEPMEQAPVPLYPQDNSENRWISLFLSWDDARFIDSGQIVYDCYLNSDLAPANEIAHGISATSLETTNLLYGTDYTWKIIA